MLREYIFKNKAFVGVCFCVELVYREGYIDKSKYKIIVNKIHTLVNKEVYYKKSESLNSINSKNYRKFYTIRRQFLNKLIFELKYN